MNRTYVIGTPDFSTMGSLDERSRTDLLKDHWPSEPFILATFCAGQNLSGISPSFPNVHFQASVLSTPAEPCPRNADPPERSHRQSATRRAAARSYAHFQRRD